MIQRLQRRVGLAAAPRCLSRWPSSTEDVVSAGRNRKREPLRIIALCQAGVYVTTGVWPLVHLRTFEAITGRKRDDWLVKAKGAVFAAIGIGLGLAAARDRVSPEFRAMVIALG